MTQTEKVLAYGSWIAVCLIWGTTYLAIRVAVRTLPDAWMAGVRFTVAGGVLLLILLRGQELPPVRGTRTSSRKSISALSVAMQNGTACGTYRDGKQKQEVRINLEPKTVILVYLH